MLCESVPVTTKSIVTALHQFLAQKRQERTRGKLAGLETQIQELKALGASYREIAEYLYQEHGLTVTPSGLQKNLKSLEAKRSPNAAVEPSAPDPSPPAQPPAPLPPPLRFRYPTGMHRLRARLSKRTAKVRAPKFRIRASRPLRTS